MEQTLLRKETFLLWDFFQFLAWRIGNIKWTICGNIAFCAKFTIVMFWKAMLAAIAALQINVDFKWIFICCTTARTVYKYRLNFIQWRIVLWNNMFNCLFSEKKRVGEKAVASSLSFIAIFFFIFFSCSTFSALEALVFTIWDSDVDGLRSGRY